MMIKIKSSQAWFFLHTLLFLIVAVSALTYWSVAEYALNGHWHPEYYTFQTYIALVPAWQKLLKDGLAGLLLIFSLMLRPTNPIQNYYKDKKLTISYVLCALVLSIALVRSVDSDFSLGTIISSLRPIFFVISLFVFCTRHLTFKYLFYVLEGVNILVIIQVYYAFLQRQSAVLQNGADWLTGSGARSVGTFIGPNTLGLFLAIVFFTNLYILPWHNLRFFLLALCAYGILLSDSRTSLLIIVLLSIEHIFIKMASKFSESIKDFYAIQAMGVIFALINVSFLLNKVKDVSVRSADSSSSGGRLEILFSFIDHQDIFSILFGKSLAYGSNLVLTLQASNESLDSNNFIADSTWTSLLAQFGLLGVLLLIAVVWIILQNPKSRQLSFSSPRITTITKSFNVKKIGFLIYLLPASITIILLETYAVLPIIVSVLFFIKLQLLQSIYYLENTNER